MPFSTNDRHWEARLRLPSCVVDRWGGQIVESTCDRPTGDETADPLHPSSVGSWHGACCTQGRWTNETRVGSNPVVAVPRL